MRREYHGGWGGRLAHLGGIRCSGAAVLVAEDFPGREI